MNALNARTNAEYVVPDFPEYGQGLNELADVNFTIDYTICKYMRLFDCMKAFYRNVHGEALKNLLTRRAQLRDEEYPDEWECAYSDCTDGVFCAHMLLPVLRAVRTGNPIA